MAQSRKRTLAGQCPCPVQGGPSTPAALGFTAALVDSHTVWQGTPVWSDLPAAALALSCTDSELSSVELACCLHPFVVWSSWDVLSLVLLDMLSVSWVLGKAWVSHLFFFFPFGENLEKSKNYDTGTKPLSESRDVIPTTGESLSKKKGTQPELLDGCSQSPWSKLNPNLVCTFSCAVYGALICVSVTCNQQDSMVCCQRAFKILPKPPEAVTSWGQNSLPSRWSSR